MDINESIIITLTRLISAQETKRSPQKRLRSADEHDLYQSEDGFTLDMLISARSSIKKYPFSLRDIRGELMDVAGFSEHLISYLEQNLSALLLDHTAPKLTKCMKPEIVCAQRSPMIGSIETLRKYKLTSKRPIDITLVVDTRERGKNKSFVEHLRNLNPKQRSFKPSINKIVSSNFNGIRGQCNEDLVLRSHCRSTKKPRVCHKFSIKERMLPLGDFLWVYDHGGDECMIPLIVERKTISDLAGSIIDGRLHEQLNRLHICPSPWVILLVEGPLSDGEQCTVTDQALRSALTAVTQVHGFSVFCVNDMRESILVLKSITRRIRAMLQSFDLKNLSFRFPQENYMQWVKQVKQRDDERERSVCFYNMLCAIEGIGHEAAEKVALAFRSPLALFQYFESILRTDDEINAEFSLTAYESSSMEKPKKLCSAAASSAIFNLFGRPS